MEKIDITLTSSYHAKQFKADARFIQNGEPKPIILFVHGFKGFKDWGAFNLIADYFAEAGFVFIKMNFSHNGLSLEEDYYFEDLEAFGQNNFSIELDDIDVMLKGLGRGGKKAPIGKEELDFNQIGIIGHSRGGSIALLKATESKKIKVAVSWAAVDDLVNQYAAADKQKNWEQKKVIYIKNGRTKQNMPMYYQFYQDTVENAKRFSLEKALKKMKKPILAFHGSEDEALPIQMAKNIESWGKTVKLIEVKGADHVFGAKHPYTEEKLPEVLEKVCEQTVSFFKENLK
jgi:dipeptidyl aminopeptidase/acylaminoacyl peptidase